MGMREEMIEAAHKWLEENTGFRRATEPEGNVSVERLNRQMRMRAKTMADFALEQLNTRANTRDRWVAVEERQELIKAAEKFCWERIQDDHPPFSAIPEVAADFALHTRAAGGNEVKTGIDLIADERQRQMDVEGWTPEHDDAHRHGELAKAAAVYALLGTDAETKEGDDRSAWPWSPQWFKPSTPIRDLVKAGALIAAEIDRIQRADKHPPANNFDEKLTLLEQKAQRQQDTPQEGCENGTE